MEDSQPNPDVLRTEGQSLEGTIKVWNVDKGFGFVTCADGGPDLFVHQSALVVDGDRFRAVMPGTEVVCIYYMREGKETARECTGQAGPLPGFASKLEAAQQQGIAGGHGKAMLTGTIKFMNQEKGFGFIVPDAGGDDVFVHVGDIEGQQMLQTGEPVSYTTAVKKGVRSQAVNVTCLRMRTFPMQAGYGAPPGYHNGYDPYAYGAPPPQAYGAPPHVYDAYSGYDFGGPPGSLSGTVKWYNSFKGFGFIIPANGGPDVYFKGQDVQSQVVLTENEQVTYETKSAPDGKLWAVSVSRVRGAKRKGPAEAADGGYKRPTPIPTHYSPHSPAGGPSGQYNYGAQYAHAPTSPYAAQPNSQYVGPPASYPNQQPSPYPPSQSGQQYPPQRSQFPQPANGQYEAMTYYN